MPAIRTHLTSTVPDILWKRNAMFIIIVRRLDSFDL